MFYIGLYREQHEKIFLSETTRPRALMLGMIYHLVNQKRPRVGGHRFNIGFYMEKHETIFLSETTGPRALRLGMKHHLVASTKFVQIRPLGPKLATPQGSQAYIGRNIKNLLL